MPNQNADWTFFYERSRYFDHTPPKCPVCGDDMRTVIVGAFPLLCHCDKCGVRAGKYGYLDRFPKYSTKPMRAEVKG